MDIHKPKPWHGAREFLKEYLIIVIGVLTALGAEAVVATVHENRLSGEARESVRAEINLDLASLKQFDQLQPCVVARFAEIDAALAAADEGRPFPMLAYIGRPRMPSAYTQRWEAATTGGRTSLLSTDEQRDFARVYSRLFEVNIREREELAAWGRLKALEGVKHPSAETLALARQALSEARSMHYSVRASAVSARGFAGRIGIKGDVPIVGSSHLDASCLPTNTRREDAAGLTGDVLGAP